MTVITIDHPMIQQKYSSKELQTKFLDFLITEMWENTVNLYEISVDELSPKSKKKFEQRENLEFVEY